MSTSKIGGDAPLDIPPSKKASDIAKAAEKIQTPDEEEVVKVNASQANKASAASSTGGKRSLIVEVTYVSPKIIEQNPTKESLLNLLPHYVNLENQETVEEILIEPFKAATLDETQISASPELLKEVRLTKEELVALCNHWNHLVVDPVNFLAHLAPLDAALGAKMEERNITFSKEDNPKYLVALYGFFAPGPPNQPLKEKGRIVNETLLEQEQGMGINLEGAPVFVGGVKPPIANPFVAEGNVFKEDVQVSRLILHGKNSHRLAILALIDSLKNTPFSHLQPEEVVKILVETKIVDRNGWQYLIDQVGDSLKSSSEPEKIENYCFSCRSPFVLNSILLCFGDRLGLPNLMCCLRDSHWKEMEKMSKNLLPDQPDKKTSDGVHNLILSSLAKSQHIFDDIGTDYAFTIPKTKRIQDPKYKLTDIQGVAYKYERGEKPTVEEAQQKKEKLSRFFGIIVDAIKEGTDDAMVLRNAFDLEQVELLPQILMAAVKYNRKDLIAKIFNGLDYKTIPQPTFILLLIILLKLRNIVKIDIKPLIDHWDGSENKSQAERIIHLAIATGNKRAVELILAKFPEKLNDKNSQGQLAKDLL